MTDAGADCVGMKVLALEFVNLLKLTRFQPCILGTRNLISQISQQV